MNFQVVYSNFFSIKEIYFFLKFLYIVIQALEPLLLDKYNYPIVDLTTMSTSEAGVFCGGDLAQIASTTVESVNDGKTAAWHIHRFIQV
jgi:dihydropyrimidine dehydrogenase (NADP+)